MVKRTEGITDRLLEAAKSEFLEKGYEGASLRSIAARANSSKGAIYVRYSDKAALFDAVVDPAIDGLCDSLAVELGGYESLSADEKVVTRDTYADKGIEGIVDYIYNHFDEFKIVVDTGGAKFEAMLHRLIELELRTTVDYLETVDTNAFKAESMAPELLHMVVSSYFSGIFQTVAHGLSRARAKKYIERLNAFYRAGWAVLFEDAGIEGPRA